MADLLDAKLKPERTSNYTYLVVFSINLALIATGTTVAWSSPCIPKLNEIIKNQVTKDEETLIASLFAIGGVFSPFPAGLSTDLIGRRKSLLIFNAPIVLSYLLIFTAENVWMLYAARFCSGFSAAANFVIVPSYVAELSEKHNRGMLSCMLAPCVTFGVLLMYSLGPYVSIKTSSLIGLVPPLLLFVTVILYVPESFYYLLGKRDEAPAAKSLRKLRKWNSSEIKVELQEIGVLLNEHPEQKLNLFQLLSRKHLRSALGMSTLLMVFQQCTGINVILYYMQPIFETTGSDLPAEISTILIGSVQFLAAAATPLIIDRLGRCFLLQISGFGNAISLIAMGTFFYIKETGNSVDSILWLPITSLVLYVTAFNLGIGPVCWVILAEIFPPEAKAAASTWCVSLNFFLAFVITTMFPYMLVILGSAVSFWCFAAFAVASVFFVYFCVPETKGISFAEIQQKLHGETN